MTLPKLENIKHVYMLGIGGIGMSAIARYFKAMGKQVAGYDKTETSLTQALEAEGLQISYTDTVEKLPAFLDSKTDTLIVYTPAIPGNLQILNFLKLNHEIYKRSQVLGMLLHNTASVAVAGTHGKTTTSCMVTHLLKSKGIPCSAFLGGISNNYHTNFVRGDVYAPNHVVVVEADEFDRSFLTLFPTYAIITSTDADHLDIYNNASSLLEGYNAFANQVSPQGKLLCRKGLQINAPNIISYAAGEVADAYADNIKIVSNEYVFDYHFQQNSITNIHSGMPGRHNVENAVAAITVALLHGAGPEEIKHGVASFAGVKRRFEYQLRYPQITYIDDYAHHPSELSAAINSARELFVGKKITAIFQPHLFSRTRDFAQGFAASLSLADYTVLLPIYPARELPIPGVDSAMIQSMMTNHNTLSTMDQLLNVLDGIDVEVVMTLGAGDIDTMVEPVKKVLLTKYAKQLL